MKERNQTDKKTTVEIIIPTLNEANNIGEIVRDIRSQVLSVKLSILVTDAGSTDRTVEICAKENVKVIRRKKKGKGSGMKEAVEYSTADIIVFIDGDGTYQISDLGKLLEPLLKDEADMVIGSRFKGRREKGSISTFNTIGNKIFNKSINFAMKSMITDSQSGYRALTRKLFQELVLFSENFEIEVEMIVEALAKGYRVMEVPISYRKRRNSETKLNPLNDGVRIGKTLFFIIMNVRPILFFSILSGIIFGIGAYPVAFVLYEKVVLGEIIHIPAVIFASVLIITGIIVLVLGMLSELIVRSRRRMEFLISRKI